MRVARTQGRSFPVMYHKPYRKKRLRDLETPKEVPVLIIIEAKAFTCPKLEVASTSCRWPRGVNTPQRAPQTTRCVSEAPSLSWWFRHRSGSCRTEQLEQIGLKQFLPAGCQNACLILATDAADAALQCPALVRGMAFLWPR